MKATAQIIRGDGNDSGTNGENGDKPQLATSFTQIRDLNTALIDVTRHSRICIGSIFKIDSLSYPNWGFSLTPDNAAEIRQAADFYYRKDYDERRQNENIDYLLKTDITAAHEKSMTEFMAVTIRAIMKSIDDGKRTFNICDVPSRNGNLSAAIAHALHRDTEAENILSRTIFYLVDISGQKLDRAEANLRQFRAAYEKWPIDDGLFFSHKENASFDFIVSLGHLHHKPFLVDYLKDLNRVLSNDGAVVIGDWHSPLCSHPAVILTLLQDVLEPSRLDIFREIMEVQLATPRIQIEPDEKDSLRDHISYWKGVLQRLQSNPPRTQTRLYINAAFDTSKQREKKLNEADFTINLDDVKKAFPNAHLPAFSDSKPGLSAKRFVNGSDSATVMVATKKK